MIRSLARVAALAACLAWAPLAQASIVLSQTVLDIAPGSPVATDIEVSNQGSEIAYVIAEPFEIQSPGLPGERRVAIEDPAVGGLLVSPQRLILQPGERQMIRVAAIAPRGATDRIYRLSVQPVAGAITASTTALKLLVGYDALVVYRPAVPNGQAIGSRDGSKLTVRNPGNTNVELFDGQQCDVAKPTDCATLPPHRLYAGAVWTQVLPKIGPVTYPTATGSRATTQHF